MFFIGLSAIVGGLAVAIGAFGAHALKDILLANNRTETFELASRYHFYHAFALCLLAICMHLFPQKNLTPAYYCMLVGLLIFSGSLYALALSNVGKLGAITPIGGVFLLVGWGIFAWQFLKSN